MKRIDIVTRPGMKELLELPHLFDKAVDEDFTLYDKSTRERIKNRYSLLNLVIARFRKGRVLLIARNASHCVGVLMAGYTSDGIGVVYWVYVLPRYRKKGIAKKMLNTAEELLRSKDCHKLIVTTETAQKFYQRIGYMKEAVFKKHWWGKDFWVYSKFI